MKLSRRSNQPSLDNGMLPLINVVFLLMIFFMLVGAVSPLGAFDPEPIRAKTGLPADRDPDTLLVSVEGPMAIGAEVFTMAEVAPVIEHWKSVNPRRALRVLADGRMPADALIELLETLRGVGIERIQLVTRGDAP